MMENAGLQLANLIAHFSEKEQHIRIGVGNGNNGGGGLVAARRLAGWGYRVSIDLFTEINKELPVKQLIRAKKFGVTTAVIENPDVWVDGYLGFSQRLPLQKTVLEIIEKANKSTALKISLDIPTGYLGDTEKAFFQADKVLSLAAPKKILNLILSKQTEIYIANIGIPKVVYKKFGLDILPFHQQNILK